MVRDDKNEIILSGKNISRVFSVGKEKFYALRNVDIEIPKGKLTILKGRSGSGKTTLLNILSALDEPTGGEVFFNGASVNVMSNKQKEKMRRNNMGFVFQSVGLIPIMTAQENIDFELRLAGYKNKPEERIKNVLEMVGLYDRRLHMPTEMSGGEQQRIAIARAIAHKPELVFADEPTGALDTMTGLSVMKLFKELVAREGITIVMTTHDVNLMEMGDVVYELEDGEIVGRKENLD